MIRCPRDAQYTAPSPHYCRPVPRLILRASTAIQDRYQSFFIDRITNPHTRQAYANAVEQFLRWLDHQNISLERIGPQALDAYKQGHSGSPSTVSQHMAAIRRLLLWLAPHGVAPSLRPSPKETKPSTVSPSPSKAQLPAKDVDRLLKHIGADHVIALRDQSLIACLFYGQGPHVGALANLSVGDYCPKKGTLKIQDRSGANCNERLHPKAHRVLQSYYEAAGLQRALAASPLFRSVRGRAHSLSDRGLHRTDILRMIKRRARAAGIDHPISCDTVRRMGLKVSLVSDNLSFPDTKTTSVTTRNDPFQETRRSRHS